MHENVLAWFSTVADVRQAKVLNHSSLKTCIVYAEMLHRARKEWVRVESADEYCEIEETKRVVIKVCARVMRFVSRT